MNNTVPVQDWILHVHTLLANAERPIHARPLSTRKVRTPATTEVARFLDLTLLKPEAGSRQFEMVFHDAREFGVRTVCVPPNRVGEAVTGVGGSGVEVCTVIGFPLGYATTAVKSAEADDAVQCGADELDMVIPVGMIKQVQDTSSSIIRIYDDIAAVVRVAEHRIVKVIIETALLTEQEKVVACSVAAAAGASMVKTSTGFSTKGASVADVRLMRSVVGDRYGVKASGGIRTYADAMQMIIAGADRIGASAGRAILAPADNNDADQGEGQY